MAENKSGAPAAETPAEAPAGGKAAKSKKKRKMTKMDAVRKALAAMGRDAKPSEMQPYIKTKFGIVMTTDHISTYKGDILKKEAEAAAKAHPPAPAKPAAPRLPAAAAPAQREGGPASGSGSVLLEDVLTTKALLDRIGAERLRILINGLAK